MGEAISTATICELKFKWEPFATYTKKWQVVDPAEHLAKKLTRPTRFDRQLELDAVLAGRRLAA